MDLKLMKELNRECACLSESLFDCVTSLISIYDSILTLTFECEDDDDV